MQSDQTLTASAQKVQAKLKELGVTLNVVELSESTRTAQDAATTIGCTVSQIAKSLVFQKVESKKLVLIIMSGSNFVDESKASAIIGEKISRADPKYVKEQTGFAIGGIPPVGHLNALEVFIDEDLMQYQEIWAAAGTPHGVFQLTPTELVNITKGAVGSYKR